MSINNSCIALALDARAPFCTFNGGNPRALSGTFQAHRLQTYAGQGELPEVRSFLGVVFSSSIGELSPGPPARRHGIIINIMIVIVTITIITITIIIIIIITITTTITIQGRRGGQRRACPLPGPGLVMAIVICELIIGNRELVIVIMACNNDINTNNDDKHNDINNDYTHTNDDINGSGDARRPILRRCDSRALEIRHMVDIHTHVCMYIYIYV